MTDIGTNNDLDTEQAARPKPKLTAIIPVMERYDPIEELYLEYREGLEATGVSFEILYILDGAASNLLPTLRELVAANDDTKLVVLPRSYGEATALSMGFGHAQGDKFIVLPAFRQIESSAIPTLIAASEDVDLVSASRYPRQDGFFNSLQAKIFSSLVNRISGLKLTDAGCGVRVLDRQLLENVELYGEFHRFLPMLASRRGYEVKEVQVPQAKSDLNTRIYAPGIYLRRLLDVLTIYFLVRFTKKPFRFFGLIGTAFMMVGFLLSALVVYDRLFYDVALASRPMFLVGTLLLVFGVQIISVGLIGEIVIFGNARNQKEYSIKEVVG